VWREPAWTGRVDMPNANPIWACGRVIKSATARDNVADDDGGWLPGDLALQP
jgi:hypothetical protein